MVLLRNIILRKSHLKYNIKFTSGIRAFRLNYFNIDVLSIYILDIYIVRKSKLLYIL